MDRNNINLFETLKEKNCKIKRVITREINNTHRLK